MPFDIIRVAFYKEGSIWSALADFKEEETRGQAALTRVQMKDIIHTIAMIVEEFFQIVEFGSNFLVK